MTLPKSVSSFESVVRRKITTNYKLLTTNWRHKRLGFTLVELLVVISIISILVGVATASWTNAQQKGRDGKRKTDLAAIQQALELHFQRTGHYPPWNGTDEIVGWCTIINNSDAGAKAEVHDKLVPAYISKMPKDPIYGGQTMDYFYRKEGVGKYYLYTVLENPNDPDKSGPYDNSGCGLGSNQYNYRVNQP